MTVSPERVAGGLWLIWLVCWLAAAVSSDRTVKAPAGSQHLVYRALAAIGAVLLFGSYRHRPASEIPLWHTPDPVGWIMVAVVIIGLLVTGWARIHLGRLWSGNVARKADHHVVDTGPYGIVRHPIYTGIIVATIAMAVMRGTAMAWVGFAFLTLGWYIKARMEEAFLREQLGAADYDRYASRIPMLIPFL
jgi:protein-S-isoprenylcysteine O-methyltransferase Ste14